MLFKASRKLWEARWAASIGVACLAACDSGRGRGIETAAAARQLRPSLSAPVDTAVVVPQAGPLDSSAVAVAVRGAVDSIIVAVDSSTTLGHWRAAHPKDSVDVRRLTEKATDRACRTAASSWSAAGLTFERHALFYTPDLSEPGKIELPADTSLLVERVCKLGALAINVSTRDTVLGSELLRVAENETTRRVGAVTIEHHDMEFGTTTDGRFVLSPLRVLITREALGSPGSMAAHRDSAAREKAGSGRTMESVAAAEQLVRKKAIARIDSALGWSETPGIASRVRPLVDYLRTATERPAHKDALDSVLIRAVYATRDTAPLLPPARRAATYLAMDLIFNAYAGEHDAPDAEDPQQRKDSAAYAIDRAVRAAGLTFKPEPMTGGTAYYAREWLFKAFEADSDSHAGRSAFIQLLADGWRTDPGCPASFPTEREMVVDHGESALRFGNHDPLTHYYLGLAYADMFSDVLLELANPGDADWKRARLRAIGHLRQTIEATQDPAIRRDAQHRTMRLLLGLPTEPYFDCSYPG